MKIFFIVLLSFSTTILADEITLAADQWCPYNCRPNDKNPGAVVEIAREALKAKGHTLKYQNINWSRAIELTRNGKINGVLGAFYSDAPDLIYPKNEQIITKNCFYSKQNSTSILKLIKDLKGKKVGSVKDYTYGETVDEFRQTSQGKGIFEDATGEDPLLMNIKKVAAGRLNFLIENDAVVDFKLSQHAELKDSLKLSWCLPSFKTYVAFSPKNPKSREYAKILSDFMLESRKNGKLKEILKKYNIKEW